MYSYALLALLPSLALAANVDVTITQTAGGPTATITQAPSLPDSSSFTFEFCETATGAAGLSCLFTAEGFSPAAAGYLASLENDPAASSVLGGVLMQSAIDVPFRAALSSLNDAESTNTAINPSIFESVFVGNVAQHLSEVPSGTARDAVASIFSNLNVLQAGATPAASSPGAAAQSSSKGAAPRQTGLVVAAGVMAGVVGMAVGL